MPATITCLEVATLKPFLLGQSPAAETASLGVHLEGCSHCLLHGSTLETEGAVVAAMRARAAAEEPEMDLVESLLQRVRRQGRPAGPLRAAAPVPSPARRRRSTSPTAPGPTASWAPRRPRTDKEPEGVHGVQKIGVGHSTPRHATPPRFHQFATSLPLDSRFSTHHPYLLTHMREVALKTTPSPGSAV